MSIKAQWVTLRDELYLLFCTLHPLCGVAPLGHSRTIKPIPKSTCTLRSLPCSTSLLPWLLWPLHHPSPSLPLKRGRYKLRTSLSSFANPFLWQRSWMSRNGAEDRWGGVTLTASNPTTIVMTLFFSFKDSNHTFGYPRRYVVYASRFKLTSFRSVGAMLIFYTIFIRSSLAVSLAHRLCIIIQGFVVASPEVKPSLNGRDLKKGLYIRLTRRNRTEPIAKLLKRLG